MDPSNLTVRFNRKKLRKLRERRGFTRQMLADQCGVVVRHIEDLESGERLIISVEMLYRLGIALKVPMEYFLDVESGGAEAETNLSRIRRMSDMELALFHSRPTEVRETDYGMDDEPYDSWNTYYVTSDGEEYLDEDDAVGHELWWFYQPSDEKQI